MGGWFGLDFVWLFFVSRGGGTIKERGFLFHQCEILCTVIHIHLLKLELTEIPSNSVTSVSI